VWRNDRPAGLRPCQSAFSTHILPHLITRLISSVSAGLFVTQAPEGVIKCGCAERGCRLKPAFHCGRNAGFSRHLRAHFQSHPLRNRSGTVLDKDCSDVFRSDPIFQESARMRSVFLKLVWCAIVPWFGSSIMVAAAGPGNLDSSFAGTAWLQLGFGRAYDIGQAVAVQSDGKIVVAGVRLDTQQVLLLRLGANNLPDPSFGSGGVAAVTPPHPPSADAFALQPKVAVAIQRTEKLWLPAACSRNRASPRTQTAISCCCGLTPMGPWIVLFGNNGIVSRDFVMMTSARRWSFRATAK